MLHTASDQRLWGMSCFYVRRCWPTYAAHVPAGTCILLGPYVQTCEGNQRPGLREHLPQTMFASIQIEGIMTLRSYHVLQVSAYVYHLFSYVIIQPFI